MYDITDNQIEEYMAHTVVIDLSGPACQHIERLD